GGTVCTLRREKALCRGAFVHARSRLSGAVRRLRAHTPSSCKCSPGRVPRHAWHDLLDPRHITTPGVQRIIRIFRKSLSRPSTLSRPLRKRQICSWRSLCVHIQRPCGSSFSLGDRPPSPTWRYVCLHRGHDDPAVLTIWVGQQAAGVSLLSWSAYLASAILWFWFGIQKRDKHIYLRSEEH